MSEVEAIEARIRELPGEDFAELQAWFHAFENERWDKQIASDYKAGKFDDLINKAKAEFTQGKAREL
jgi:hypothetical protein